MNRGRRSVGARRQREGRSSINPADLPVHLAGGVAMGFPAPTRRFLRLARVQPHVAGVEPRPGLDGERRLPSVQPVSRNLRVEVLKKGNGDVEAAGFDAEPGRVEILAEARPCRPVPRSVVQFPNRHIERLGAEELSGPAHRFVESVFAVGRRCVVGVRVGEGLQPALRGRVRKRDTF